MSGRGGGTVSIEFFFEDNSGEEIAIDVEATIAPFSPAVLNPVDLSHPDEGGEIEDLFLKRDGKSLDVDEAIAMGLNMEKLEEAVYEAASNMDEDYDDSYDERDFDCLD